MKRVYTLPIKPHRLARKRDFAVADKAGRLSKTVYYTQFFDLQKVQHASSGISAIANQLV